MTDSIIRAIAGDGTVRVTTVSCTEAAIEACKRHKTRPGSTVILAETLVGVSLLSPMLHGDQKLSLQLTGNGPARGVMADVDSQGNLRGIIQNTRLYGRRGLGKRKYQPFGKDAMLVLMHSTPSKLVSRGSMPFADGGVVDALEAYWNSTEAFSTVVAIKTDLVPNKKLNRASGVMIESLSKEDPFVFDELKKMVKDENFWDNLRPEKTNSQALLKVMELSDGGGWSVITESDLRFGCRCSREKVIDMLHMLEKKDLEQMRTRPSGVEVTCRFCNEEYHLDKEELFVLLAELDDIQ